MISFGRKNVGMLQKLLVSTFTLFVLAHVAFSQATSGVTGVVSDATGKVVPGVAVTLTDTKTDRSFTTTSNDQGSYTFTNIPPGDGYKLSFAVQGFQTLAISNVTLGVAKTETQDAVLSAGDVTATVDVVASGSGDTLNTTDPSIGNVIDTRQLRELPIQIRNSPAALISLQPGVVGNNVGTGATNRVGSVAGSRADQGNITVDGIDANDQATGQFAATVGNAPIDAIQEFRAITVNPSASEGRSSGGQVQLVTKSGTNDFHGSLRLYNRNEKFAANSFFNNRTGVRRPKLNRNQFGGNLGGPLPFPNFGDHDDDDPFWKSGRDRLFFFFDYEGRRDAQEVTYTRTVPLAHFRNGSLAYISGGTGCAGARLNTNPACITILTPTQVTALDPAGIGPNAGLLSFINSRYPAPNDLTLGDGLNTGGLRFNAPSSRQDNTYTTRFDGNISDRQKAFVRFNIARRTQTDTVNSVAAQFPGDPAAALIVVKDWSLAAGHNWSITDSLYNSLTIGNSHSGLDFPNDFNPNFPNEFTFGTLTAPFAGIDTQSRVVDTPTFRDDATWVKGSHTFMFGASYKPIKSVSGIVNDFNNVGVGLGGGLTALDASVRPGILGSPAITQGTANYDASFAFLLGRLGSVATTYTYGRDGIANAPGTGKLRDFRYNEYEYYVQDNWKIRNDLTLNLGLRYQYYSPPYEKNGFQAGNDIDLNDLIARRVANAASGTASPTSEPFLSYTLIGRGNDARPYYEGDKNNFAPRIGFAYSPSFSDGFMKSVFGDRKTSIRGGASIVYERVGGGLTFIQDQVSYLFDNSASSTFGGLSPFDDLQNDPRFISINTLPVSNTAPVITNPLIPFVDEFGPFGLAANSFNYTIAQDFQVPYSYQYSIGFQRELPGNFLLDVSYAGRIGKKLFTQADAAQAMNFKDPVSGQLLFDALNAIQTQLQTGGSATVAAQPWFENVIGAFRGSCAPTTCTALVINNATRRNFIFRGDTTDLIQNMFLNNFFGNPLLPENVGISAQFADNIYITNLGKSRYDALLVSLSKRFSQGVSFDLNYTYSHSKDNNSSVANTVIGGLVQDILNPDVGYGPSDFDIRHLANANFIWELPFGRGKWIGGNANSWVNQAIGGWQLSGIYTFRSGLPMQVGTNSFPLSFTLEAPALLIGDIGALGGNIDTTSASTINFFGTPAQAAAALESFRNVRNGESGSRNVLRGPSFWNFDLSLAKNFTLPWEGHRIQLRMDAFNVFNRNVFANPSALTLSGLVTHNNAAVGGGLVRNCTATSTNCGFGTITTSASAPREVQFAVRWDF